MAKNKKAASGRRTALPQAPRGEKMDKARELSILMTLKAAGQTGVSILCDYCNDLTELPSMTCITLHGHEALLVTWSCSRCLDKPSHVRRVDCERVRTTSEEQVDAFLLASAKWLDFALLRKNGRQPYVRRPWFEERQQALAKGVVLPDSSAVVISPLGESDLERYYLPIPYPWLPAEWWAGPVAAQSALDLADAIERGEVGVLAIREKGMLFASGKVLEGMVRWP